MKTFGIFLMVLGVIGLLFALTAETTVPSYSSSLGSGGTFNLGLLQAQMVTLHTSLAACIIGSILVAAGAIVECLRPDVSLDQEPKVPKFRHPDHVEPADGSPRSFWSRFIDLD